MNMALEGLGDVALGEAVRRCVAELGIDAGALSAHDAARLGATLRRQLPQPTPLVGIGFHRPGDTPGNVSQRMGQLLLDWWQQLQDNTGDRAALRRADNLSEIVAVPTFHQLRWRIDALLANEGRGLSAAQRDRLAVAAALAAHVRESRGHARGLVGQMAGGDGETAPVSALRFRRMLQADKPSDLFRQLRRALAMLGGHADLLALADDVLNWGEQRRKRWAYAYYCATPPKG